MTGFGAGRIHFFRSLAHSASSGMPITRALSIVGRSDASMPAAVIASLQAKVEAGKPFAEALAAQAGFFPDWQLEIVRVGEATGRLDGAFVTIAELLEERRSFVLGLLSGLAYPLVLLHIAPFLLYGSLYISQGTIPFITAVVVFFLWFYVPVGLLWFTWNSSGMSSRSLPFFSSFSKAQFCFYLSALIKAAVPLRKALELSAQAAGVPAASASAPGESATAQIRRYRVFSEEDLARIEVAEESGKLDEDLNRLAAQAREQWQALLKTAVAILPVVIYLIIGLSIAYHIISFYNGYYSQIDNIFK